jgi:ABC-type transport system involved in cytochrome c biogenesis permease subunit
MPKPLAASNFFESSKFLFTLTWLFFFNYTTIARDKFNRLQLTTTTAASIKFVIYVAFGVYSMIDLLKHQLDTDDSRSLILEIGVYMKCRLQLLQPLMAAVVGFLNRRKFFEMIRKFEVVDEKVRKM